MEPLSALTPGPGHPSHPANRAPHTACAGPRAHYPYLVQGLASGACPGALRCIGPDLSLGLLPAQPHTRSQRHHARRVWRPRACTAEEGSWFLSAGLLPCNCRPGPAAFGAPRHARRGPRSERGGRGLVRRPAQLFPAALPCQSRRKPLPGCCARVCAAISPHPTTLRRPLASRRRARSTRQIRVIGVLFDAVADPGSRATVRIPQGIAIAKVICDTNW